MCVRVCVSRSREHSGYTTPAGSGVLQHLAEEGGRDETCSERVPERHGRDPGGGGGGGEGTLNAGARRLSGTPLPSSRGLDVHACFVSLDGGRVRQISPGASRTCRGAAARRAEERA
ncbi:hypothetical protein PLESTM_000425200 [Pleodorina starrii]|nr:hypothetical protein PLESTM_000425200 [Pleodorina starrii]